MQKREISYTTFNFNFDQNTKTRRIENSIKSPGIQILYSLKFILKLFLLQRELKSCFHQIEA